MSCCNTSLSAIYLFNALIMFFLGGFVCKSKSPFSTDRVSTNCLTQHQGCFGNVIWVPSVKLIDQLFFLVYPYHVSSWGYSGGKGTFVMKEKNNPAMQAGSLGPRNVNKVLPGQPDDPLSCVSTQCKQAAEEREGKQSTKDYSWHVLELLLALRGCPIILGLKATM